MATITEDYVSFETAKLLKEKGFNEPTLAYIYSEGMISYFSRPRIVGEDKTFINLPTQQMAIAWLREIHDIVIGVNIYNENNRDNTDYYNPDRWWYFWEFTDTRGVYREELQPDALTNEYPTYEEACEAAIKYCLENLINKKGGNI